MGRSLTNTLIAYITPLTRGSPQVSSLRAKGWRNILVVVFEWKLRRRGRRKPKHRCAKGSNSAVTLIQYNARDCVRSVNGDTVDRSPGSRR